MIRNLTRMFSVQTLLAISNSILSVGLPLYLANSGWMTSAFWSIYVFYVLGATSILMAIVTERVQSLCLEERRQLNETIEDLTNQLADALRTRTHLGKLPDKDDEE